MAATTMAKNEVDAGGDQSEVVLGLGFFSFSGLGLYLIFEWRAEIKSSDLFHNLALIS